METRANYVLIGAFALAGFLGLLVFLLVFARIELDRQFDYYEVNFTSVGGLSRASEVRFAGLPVGQVVDVRLAPERDGSVLVRLEIAGEVPVRADSEATIEMMGVTGVSYVGISAGSAEAPLLDPSDSIPQIRAGRSVLQTLTEDAPEILAEALTLVRQVSELFDASNQQKVQNILDNLERSSEELSQALIDFAGVSQTVAMATADIAYFTTILEPVVEASEATLQRIDMALETYTALGARAIEVLEDGDEVLEAGQRALDAAETFLSSELPGLMTELTATAEGLRGQIDTLGSQAEALMAGFTETGTLANARLAEAQQTIVATDTMLADLGRTLDTVDRAAASFDALISGDGAALVAETRDMISRANEAVTTVSNAAETDLPAIVADIRGATETANRVIADVGANLTTASNRFDAVAEDAEIALEQVTDTFARANLTLENLDRALATGERTLEAAERTFLGADRVINEEIGAIATDLRAAMARLDGAIAQVSDDIPEVSASLRAAASSAEEAFAEIGRMVAASGGPVRDFTTRALPQFTQLARETRVLITNLDRLARQIERDPARFFLGRQTPEFRR